MTERHVPEDTLEVRSPDGTSLAVWVEGTGPALVLVHGGIQDHTAYRPLLSALRGTTMSFAMDRRGRGASTDGPGVYDIEREFEDVAAVVDAVAGRTGGPVALWGHSYGADCAMGAATLTKNVHHLILYEPGLGVTFPSQAVDAVDAAIEAGDREKALIVALRDILELTDEEIDLYRASPAWPSRLAAVPTLPREMRAEERWKYGQFRFDRVTAPTLVLSGSESPPEQQEATRRAVSALPNARVEVLNGHGHIAHQTDPNGIAAIVATFTTS